MGVDLKDINTKALYTVIENQTTTYFHSYNAGGLSFPFHIYDKTMSIAETIKKQRSSGHSLDKRCPSADVN